jgi:hypothetical protein
VIAKSHVPIVIRYAGRHLLYDVEVFNGGDPASVRATRRSE